MRLFIAINFTTEVRNHLSKTIQDLSKEAVSGSFKNEFSVDDKPFQPHITLGRRCRMNSNFDVNEFAKEISPIFMKVTTINLMKSEHKEGTLMYTSLGEVKLQE